MGEAKQRSVGQEVSEESHTSPPKKVTLEKKNPFRF